MAQLDTAPRSGLFLLHIGVWAFSYVLLGGSDVPILDRNSTLTADVHYLLRISFCMMGWTNEMTTEYPY